MSPAAESAEPQRGDSAPGFEEELKAFDEMTFDRWRAEGHGSEEKTEHEQWLAYMQDQRRQADEIIKRHEERLQAELTEEGRRKAEALRALQPTGDLVEDFKAYVIAAQGQFNEDRLRPELVAAVKAGNQEVLANFFAETQSLPESTARNEGSREYQNEVKATARRILAAYRERQASATGAVH